MEASGPPARESDQIQRVRLGPDEALEAFRLCHATEPGDPVLIEDFKSNAAKGQPPKGKREKQCFLIHGGVSVYKTLEKAVARRQKILDRIGSDVPLLIGDYVARIELRGTCFAVEDLNSNDGHITIWGDPFMLADAVTDVNPA
jgi:hypothetical protein